MGSDVEIIFCDRGYHRRIYGDRKVVYNLIKSGYSLRSLYQILYFAKKEESNIFKANDTRIRHAKRRYDEAINGDNVPRWFNRIDLITCCNYERLQTKIMQESV